MSAQAQRRHTAPRVVLRFVSGRHLDGRTRGDGTFWARAAEVEPHWLFPSGSPWVKAAGWHRTIVRLTVAGALYGLWQARHLTEWALVLAGGPLAGLAIWRAVRAVRLWRHTRELVRPLSAALAPFLGVPPPVVEAGLSVRPDFEDAAGGEHVGSLGLPDHWAATSDQRGRVEEVIGARFGMDLRYQWRTHVYPMVVNMTRAPQPPTRVVFADVRELMEACQPGRLFLGLNSAAEPRYWDTGLEDPMVAISGGSRRGKTSLLLALAGQEIRQGAERVTGIDPKRVSLQPLARFGPAVRLYNDPRDIPAQWQGVAEFRQLVEDRYDALADDPTLEFRRALLIIDEVSQCAGMWAAYWRQVKPPGAPAQPPVWGDVATAVWMGAQAKAHVIVAGQRLDYAILGGMLGSFGVRMLAGYSPQDYARLVGQTPYIRSQKPRGRFLIYAGGELEWLQLVKVDDPDRDYSEFRAWVLAGRQGAAQGAADVPGMQGQGQGDAGLIVGLGAAAARLSMTLEGFKKARQRRPVDGETTADDGRPAWPETALTAWRDGRPSVRLIGRVRP